MKARTKSEWRSQVTGARTMDDVRALIDQLDATTAKKLELANTLAEIIYDDYMGGEGLTEAEAVQKITKRFLAEPWHGVWDGQHR